MTEKVPSTIPSLSIVHLLGGLALCALIENALDGVCDVWSWDTWCQFAVYAVFIAHYLIDDLTQVRQWRLATHPAVLMSVFAGWACFSLACMAFSAHPVLSGIVTCLALVCFTGVILREYAECRAAELARAAAENILFLIATIGVLVANPDTLVAGIIWLIPLAFMGLGFLSRCRDAAKGRE